MCNNPFGEKFSYPTYPQPKGTEKGRQSGNQ